MKTIHSINTCRSLQEHLAYDLHEKAGVEIGACGLDEIKQFQMYLSDYQIINVSKEHQNSFIISGPEKDKNIYLFLHDHHYEVITSMQAFFTHKRCCHTFKMGMIVLRIIYVLMDMTCVIFQTVLLCLGFLVIISLKSQACFNQHKENIAMAMVNLFVLLWFKCDKRHTVVRRG